MPIHVVQTITAWMFHPIWSNWLWQASIDSPLLAQKFNENVFSRFNTALDHFIATGQIWAMLAGLVIGYLVRGFTTYG